MIGRGGKPELPRLYIEEWMETIQDLDRKRLADRMGVSPGTITKKLADPAKIDVEWLARFASALNAGPVPNLFVRPGSLPERPDPDAQLRSMLLSFGVDGDELDQVMRVIRTYVSADAKSERSPDEAQTQPANPRRAREPLE